MPAQIIDGAVGRGPREPGNAGSEVGKHGDGCEAAPYIDVIVRTRVGWIMAGRYD